MNPVKPTAPRSGTMLGGVFVITILLSLVLCIFSLLTFYRARTDYNYLSRTAQTVTKFYEADALAEYHLQALSALAENTDLQHAPDVMTAYLDENEISANWAEEDCVLSFSIPAGEQGNLSCQLTLSEGQGKTVITLSKRCLESLPFPDDEQTLNLFIPD